MSANDKEDDEVKRITAQSIESLMASNSSEATKAYWKSTAFKVLDNFIRFVSIMTGIAIGVLGIDLVVSPGNTSIAAASAAMGFTIAALIQIKQEFNFDSRASVLRDCYHNYNNANNALIKLRLSNMQPMKKLDQVYKIQRKVNKIDLNMFDSTIIDIDPDNMFSKKASLRIVHPSICIPSPVPADQIHEEIHDEVAIEIDE